MRTATLRVALTMRIWAFHTADKLAHQTETERGSDSITNPSSRLRIVAQQAVLLPCLTGAESVFHPHQH